jgi:bacteriorhodopsin
VRYIQWFINAPLILLVLLLTTGLPLSDLFLTLFMILVTVVMGLVGALTPSSYKWGFFTFGVITLFYVE